MQVNNTPSSTSFTAFKFANQKSANDFADAIGELSLKTAKKALSIVDGQRSNKTHIVIESISEKVGLPGSDLFTGTVGQKELYNTQFWGMLDFLKKCAKEADAQEVASLKNSMKNHLLTPAEAKGELVKKVISSIDVVG